MPPKDFFRKNSSKIGELATKFSAYPDINRTKIESWLGNFNDDHKILAIKLLEHVDYFDNTRIIHACTNLFGQIKAIKGDTLHNTYFCGVGSAGKSGQSMLATFRAANALSGPSYNSKFIFLSELNKLYGIDELTIVLIDDFIGTGKQTLEFWEEIKELLPENADVILAIVSGFKTAIDKIQSETEIRVLTSHYLEESDRVFYNENYIFNEDEKCILKSYCDKTRLLEPYGYDNSQAKVVFHYRTPNNTISILGANNKHWRGLFPRYPFNY